MSNITLDLFKESFLKPTVTTTLTDVTLSGLQNINSINLVEGNYVKVNNQTNADENGFYRVTTSNWILEDPKPLIFFINESRMEDYYTAINNGLFKIASCILQESFNNLNIDSLNYIINPISSLLELHSSNFNVLYLKEQDFFIDMNNFINDSSLGVFHIYDLLERNPSNNSYSFKRINYFMLELAKQHLTLGSVYHSELNSFLSRNLNRTNDISLEYKKYVIADYLTKKENNRSLNYYNVKNTSLLTLKYFYNLFELVKNNSIINGILFENIVNEESFNYFIQKMSSFNCCNNLINKINII